MLDFFKKFKFFGIGFLILSIIIISIFYSILKPKKVLPIYQPARVSTELVDTTIQYKKKYHKIADFSLINQNGDMVDLDGRKINEFGHFLNDKGERVDIEGNLLDDNGRYITTVDYVEEKAAKKTQTREVKPKDG